MLKKIAVVMLMSFVTVGCASVTMASKEETNQAKQFTTPPAGKAGIYIYRDSMLGAALKKDVTINGKCIGETAPNMFFYEQVNGNEVYTLATESEFSPNELKLKAESGTNYFVRQSIKLGAFVGGANLDMMTPEQGKADVAKLDMGVKGSCSK